LVVYLTHGAKKNVGDYLIHSRARKLWEHVAPDVEAVSIARWEKSLPENATSLVLCGGPGLTTRMAEAVFPISGDAVKRTVPMSGLALGWHGQPARDPASFTMTGRTVAMLREMSDRFPISVRDDVTQVVAANFDIDTVRTGCAAWYSVPHLGQTPSAQHPDPKTVVFTTPARYQNTRETIAVMRMLRARFPKAKLIASFHRGIAKDDLTTARQSRYFRLQAFVARRLGFEVRDTAYDLAKIGFYQDVDLHIGYRVHAHLDFVSRRMPSVLISEDGRGTGQTESLHGEDQVLWAGSPNLVGRLEERIDHETSANWPSLQYAVDTIEATYPVMRQAILDQSRG